MTNHLTIITCIAGITLSACSTPQGDNETGGMMVGGVAGGAAGGLIGAECGGAPGALIGAGVGAVAGGFAGKEVGKSTDEKKVKLKKTAAK